MTQRQTWGEDRLYYHDEAGELVSLPREWTNRRTLDPFVEIADGRCPFRIVDLVALAGQLKGLAEAREPGLDV